MSKNIVLEIPGTSFSFFAEIFQHATRDPEISTTLKVRILNFYTDLILQKTKNNHIIYSPVDKDHLRNWLNDLIIYHRNAGKTGLSSQVEHFINEL